MLESSSAMTPMTMALVKNPDIQTHQLATVISDEDGCREELPA